MTADDSVSGVWHMRLRSGQGSWSEWLPFSPNADWSLSTGDGEKTVQAQFRDFAGIVSSMVEDRIILDTAPPSIAPTAGNGTKVRSRSFALSSSASDEGAGVKGFQVRVDDGSWIDVANSTEYTFSDLKQGKHTFYVRATDKVGHSSEASIAAIVNTSPIGGRGTSRRSYCLR